MPTFRQNQMVIGPLCNKDCSVIYKKSAVTVLSPTRKVLLRGWQETTGASIWRFPLLPNTQPQPPASTSLSPQANNAHDIPSVAALVRYLQALAGFPVKYTWLAATKSSNYTSSPGLTHTHANKYFPDADKTIKGHMVNNRQGVCSNKPHTTPSAPSATPSTPTPESVISSRELHIL